MALSRRPAGRGPGNDTFIVDKRGRCRRRGRDQGIDEVRTALASYSLALLPNVENLTGPRTTGQSLSGNARHNVIKGAAATTTRCGEGTTFWRAARADVLVATASSPLPAMRRRLRRDRELPDRNQVGWRCAGRHARRRSHSLTGSSFNERLSAMLKLIPRRRWRRRRARRQRFAR